MYAQLLPGIYNEEGMDINVIPEDSSFIITGVCEFSPTSATNSLWIKVNQTGLEIKDIIWNDSVFELNTVYQV